MNGFFYYAFASSPSEGGITVYHSDFIFHFIVIHLTFPSGQHSNVTCCKHIFCALSFAATLSEISILAASVGGACGAILILLGIVVAVRYCRKKHLENDIELHSQEREKRDVTVWWGLESQSSSVPLPLGSGLESGWLLGSTLLKKTNEVWGLEGIFFSCVQLQREFI